MRSFTALLLATCVALAACADRPIAPEKAAQYRNIGLISTLGPRFGKTVFGVFVFQNEDGAVALDFGADDLVTRAAFDLLSKRYTVVVLSEYRTAFIDEREKPGRRQPPRAADAIAADVRGVLGDRPLDAYVVIAPLRRGIRNAYFTIRGNGIIKLAAAWGGGQYRLYSAYAVYVVDGKDFEAIADMPALPVGQTSAYQPFSFEKLVTPSVPAPAVWWDAPEAHENDIRNNYKLLMDQSIPETLRRAGLIE